MTEIIVFPDAVNVCQDYLAASLLASGDSVSHVGGKVSKAYDRQVVLSLSDAETFQIVLQRSTVRFDCYVDATLGKQEAQDLAQLCRGLLGAMQGTQQAGSTVYKVIDGSPGLNDNPDDISGKARFSFLIAVTLRGEATGDEVVLTTETGIPILVV